MKVNRRDVLKAAGALGSLALFGLGYQETLRGIAKGWWAGEQPPDAISGNAPPTEVQVNRESGQVTPNPDQYVANTVCVGCTSLCGVRVRVDRNSGKVLRVSGNPYHVLSADPFIPFETSIQDSLRLTSAYQESGLTYRATACGRGNAVLDKLYDPYRVLTPLKRSGPRGSGKWQPISFQQLVEEVVEGGNLFGEGHVDGLRAIYDPEKLLDAGAPELGPKSNQLAFVAGYKEGRLRLAQRFTMFSFGSLNFTGHRGNCGLSMRAGYAALLGDWQGYPHLKPDFQNSEFIINIGTAPANAGNPFKRQGKLVAEGRSDGKLTYVTVDPALTNTDNQASGQRSVWLPVKAGGDGALAMGMMRWILENERYNAEYLSQPGPEAAKTAGEPSWCNATHLVIVAPQSELNGNFLRGSHLGLNEKGENDPFIVVDASTGKLAPHNTVEGPAELLYDGKVQIDNQTVTVNSSLRLLLEECQKFSMEEYSQACGMSADQITALADEFTSHGRKAAADCHGGTMNSNGFYTAYAAVMLNALVGNLNWKGGTGPGGGRYADFHSGPRYDMVNFPNKAKPHGVRISRRGFAYEKTSEFKKLKEAGKNPYPAQAPWYPFSASVQSEYIPSALNAYPYPLKALIFWNTNPIYGQSGLYEQVKEALADPQRMPLIISIDPFINETSAFADYIVPDTVLYESWGATAPWAATLTKVNSLRWPVVDTPLAKTPDGDPIFMESFLIAVAKRIGLPGFGEQAIPDAQGQLHPLNHPADWHLRMAANVAFDDPQPVPDATTTDMQLTNLERIRPALESTLKPEERLKVAYVLARGGRFEAESQAYQGDFLTHRYPNPLQIYNETLGTSRNSMTGELFVGTPTWIPPVFADGTPVASRYSPDEWPFLAISTKSQYMSTASAAAKRLRPIHPSNGLVLHVDDARRLGIQEGDRLRITSPSYSLEGVALVRRGIQPGVISIEHGYGRWGLGARPEQIGNKLWHASELRGAGLAINRLGISDPTRQGFSTLGDVVVGSNARQGVPVRVEKL